MAIRTISYTVSKNGIAPNTEQFSGVQGEHNATQLSFTLDNTLYDALQSGKDETDTLVYRFDGYDSVGGTVKTDTSNLTSETVTFNVGENLTRNGGNAKVYLVISQYNAEDETEVELLSLPARLRFANVPEDGQDNGESYESFSTLADIAKNAAERASASEAAAEEAQSKTELAKAALEDDSTFVFDGGNSEGYVKPDFVIDSQLSETSENAIMNKVVAGLRAEILLLAHPVGSYYISNEPTSPATLFGGTWTRFKDKSLLAAGDIYEAGNEGGEATHALTINEIPSHTHGMMHNLSDGDRPNSNALYWGTHSSQLLEPTTSVGGNQAHNNMPPYKAVYVWVRTE